MMLVIPIAAFFASILTFFSGFGLGTLLMPVMALFFPVYTAIAITAIVHLLNNIFKLVLMLKYVNYNIAIKFGAPAILASALGAYVLTLLSTETNLLKIVIGTLMILFAAAEFLSIGERISIDKKWLPAGGILSGFFGGLSGHQGAFRSAFLLHSGLSKEQFVATNSAIACMVDIVRVVVYGLNLSIILEGDNRYMVVMACIAAFAGAIAGKYLLKKVTIDYMQKLVALMLLLIGVSLITGII